MLSPGPQIMRKLSNQEIIDTYQAGTYATEIAAACGISHQRVYQILKAAGINRRQGGVYVERFASPKAERADKRDAPYARIYGCTRLQACALASSKLRSAYRYQRMNARRRGIP